MDFDELIARARRGESQAMDEIYRRFSPALLARLRGQLGPALRRRYDTEDLGQSVFADVLRDVPRFRSGHEGAFRKWLTLKARHKLFAKLRHELDGRGGRREMTWEGERADSGAHDPAAGAAAADEAARLERAMAELAPDDRDVLTLRSKDGLPYARVAEILALPSEDAARMRYARSVLKLRDLLARAAQ